MPQHVIVTGGAGFIGSHLTDALLAAGNEVTVIDDLSSGSAEQGAGTGATLRELDIVDRAALERVFEEVRPSAVYHLAAQASVTASVADPGRDCSVNVLGTLNVVDAATKLRCAAVVHFDRRGAVRRRRAAAHPRGPHPRSACSLRRLQVGRRGLRQHLVAVRRRAAR